ncbi:MAG: DNA mismatch repair protein MutS [Candidatus Amulumruptor caecigallinarius]|nr:DNA mismatch repair protein MutS [Candidatus Amulumruptor caecigallinarius]MCM1395968.1 DNA mismatch repair protein MutS [Candidatus Amulumruptor caecigallinarius]MCM1453003.1 DNA mismatch repair protein MutS [bacterium]
MKHPDAVLLFRVGDFYETFSRDAVTASDVLGITLTRRAYGKDKFVELAGFPHHALDSYLPKLVRAGLRVAICEQLDDPKIKKANDHKVTELITPNNKITPDNSQSVSPANTTDMPKKKTEQAPEQPKPQAEAPAKAEEKAEAARRAPQIITVNGDNITHGHIFKTEKQPDWMFSVKVNDRQLPTVRITEQQAEAFKATTAEKGVAEAVRDLMNVYYPSKMQKHLSKEEWTQGMTLSDGRAIDKFNVYKESNPEREGYGKWKFYASVGGEKMSRVGDTASLNAYFDKTQTPAQITERVFGERLHLASHYAQFSLPNDVKDVRLVKEDNRWHISADINGERTPKRQLSYDDGASLYVHKTATKEQLAAKYLSSDFTAMRSQQQESRSHAMRV